MGANEKHAATYHGGEYTPMQMRVRQAYARTGIDVRTKLALAEEFDRWLNQIRAESKAEALNEAADALTLEEVPDDWGIPTYENYGNWLRARANHYKETP